MGRMSDYSYLIGVKKGMMTVVEILPKVKNQASRCKGLCDCGNIKCFDCSNFRRGHQLSCGCNRTPKIVSYDYKHPLYKIWIAMRARCNNPNDAGYKNYGARGVRVCGEWESSYQSFYDWAITNGWKKGMFVDKDVKGSSKIYSPETCSIVSRATNNRHRRMVKLNAEKVIEIRSSGLPACDIAKKYGVSLSTAFFVLTKRTWIDY